MGAKISCLRIGMTRLGAHHGRLDETAAERFAAVEDFAALLADLFAGLPACRRRRVAIDQRTHERCSDRADGRCVPACTR